MTSYRLARRVAAPVPLSTQIAAALPFGPLPLDLSAPDVQAFPIETLALALAALNSGPDPSARADMSPATSPLEQQ